MWEDEEEAKKNLQNGTFGAWPPALLPICSTYELDDKKDSQQRLLSIKFYIG